MLPVQDQVQQIDFEVRLGAASPPIQMQARTFKNTSSTAVATLASNRLSFETTAYSHFPEFKEQVLACCRALVEAGVTPALRRVGLRYIDEIRIPDDDVSDARKWSTWINSRLVDQLSIGPEQASVQHAEGVVTYALADGRGLNFRFAALPQGAVVSPAALVRPPFDAERPLFVLDLDGYQDFIDPDATLFSPDIVANTLDAVHGPSGATFQAAITDEAREIFRRSEA